MSHFQLSSITAVFSFLVSVCHSVFSLTSDKLPFPEFQRRSARPATGTRMGLTVRHVGEAQQRLGRTRDGAVELQRQRRTVDVRLPHTGESRACHRNRSAGLERGHVSTLSGHQTTKQRHCTRFLRFLRAVCVFGSASLWAQKLM